MVCRRKPVERHKDRENQGQSKGQFSVPPPEIQIVTSKKTEADHEEQMKSHVGQPSSGGTNDVRWTNPSATFYAGGLGPWLYNTEGNGSPLVGGGFDADGNLWSVRVDAFPGGPSIGVARRETGGFDRGESATVKLCHLKQQIPFALERVVAWLFQLVEGHRQAAQPPASVELKTHHSRIRWWRVVLGGKELSDAMGYEVMRAFPIPESN